MKRFAACAPFILLSITACRHETVDTTPDCAHVQARFTEDILPLMLNSCAMLECHDMVTHPDGIILVNYERIVQAASQERFMNAILHEPGAEPMPKFADKLTQSDIDKIQCWILNGMPQN